MILPIVTKRTQSECPIQLKTIESATTSIRTIATIRINNKEFRCIVVKSLSVDTRCMPVPSLWTEYQQMWAEQDTIFYHNLPQILLGSDKVTLHPLPAIGVDGLPIQTSSARLLKSTLSGKYIATGYENPITNIQFCDSDETENKSSNEIDDPNPIVEHGHVTNNQNCTDRDTEVTDIHNIESQSSDSSSDEENIVSCYKTTAQIHGAALMNSN